MNRSKSVARHPGRHGERGLTLVELLVALALGLIVLLGVVYVFSGARASHRHQESYSAIQESGRIALEIVSRDVRMAGYTGCGNVAFMDHASGPSVPPVPGAWVFNNDVVITGTDGGAGSDDLTIVRGSNEQTTVVATPALNQITLTSVAALEANAALAAGDPLLVSDCSFTEVAVVQAVAGNVVTLQADLSRAVRAGSPVMRLERVRFNRDANGQLLRNGVAIVSGVQNFQVLYGIMTPASQRSAERYVVAGDPVFVPANVVSVKLRIDVADGNIPARSFNTTLALRNRAP